MGKSPDWLGWINSGLIQHNLAYTRVVPHCHSTRPSPAVPRKPPHLRHKLRVDLRHGGSHDLLGRRRLLLLSQHSRHACCCPRPLDSLKGAALGSCPQSLPYFPFFNGSAPRTASPTRSRIGRSTSGARISPSPAHFRLL